MEQFAGNVIDYFEDTYIGRLRPGVHRRALLFDLALWNMYDQTIGDLPRTNNAVEGWHRRFQANVGFVRMFCLGGFWQGRFLSRGFLSGGLCLGGFCLGGLCPRTLHISGLEVSCG